MGVSVLGEMLVKYKADISDLTSKVGQAKSDMSSMSTNAQEASDALKGLSTAGNVNLNVSEAEGQLQGLEGQAQQAREDLQGLSDAGNVGINVSGAEEQLQGLDEQVQQTKQQVQELQDSPSGGGGFLSGIKGMAGGVLDFTSKVGFAYFGVQNFANMAGQLGSTLLGPAMQMEQLTTAFTTLDGSASAATAEVQQLNTFAAKTPFQTADIDHAAASLQAFGVKASDVVPDLTGMGDALSSMGKTSGADLQQVTLAFGHIQTEGHLSGRTLMELGQLGINGMDMLQKATGKSKDELTKMISNGTLPAKDAIKDLVSGIEKSNLGGGMAKQAQTAAGQLSTLKSNANLALAALGGPLLKEAEGGLSQLGTIVASPDFQNFAKVAGTDIANAIKGIANVIGGVVTGFQNFIGWLQKGSAPAQLVAAALLSIGLYIAAISLGALIAAIPPLVVGFIAWAASAWAAAAGVIAATWPILAIIAVIALIVLAIKNWGAIWKFLQAVFSAVADWIGARMSALGSFLHGVIGGIGSFIGGVFSNLGTFLHGIIGNIGSAFSGFGTLMSSIWNGVVNTVKGAINTIISGINWFIGWIDGIQIHIPSVSIGPIQTPSFNWNGLGIPRIPYLAQGGFAQGWFVAGEQGPELGFAGNGGVQIYSNSKSKSMLGSQQASYPIRPNVASVAMATGASSGATGSASGDHTTIIELDSVEMARHIQPATDRLARLKLGPRGRAA